MGKAYVTVVSGLPRSGTSMMMQLLAAGGLPVLADARRGPDADNPHGYFEFEPVKRTAKDSSWVDGAAGKAVKVVHQLLPALPLGRHDYRVIFMRRDMGEVLASQSVMLQRAGRTGADLPPAQLGEVFAAQIRRVRDWLAGQPHFAVLDVEYANVIADPSKEAARINYFVGGVLDETAMIRAVDPSLYRQRHA